MALKRFLVFAFDPSSAGGGWRDFRGESDTRQEAESIAEKLRGQIQIVDTEFDGQVGGARMHLVYSLYRDYEQE
jgi:hypothetical protein